MLNNMEAAMLKARGFSAPIFEPIGNDVIARASKSVGNRTERAEALGKSREDAERKLLAVVTRP